MKTRSLTGEAKQCKSFLCIETKMVWKTWEVSHAVKQCLSTHDPPLARISPIILKTEMWIRSSHYCTNDVWSSFTINLSPINITHWAATSVIATGAELSLSLCLSVEETVMAIPAVSGVLASISQRGQRESGVHVWFRPRASFFTICI